MKFMGSFFDFEKIIILNFEKLRKGIDGGWGLMIKIKKVWQNVQNERGGSSKANESRQRRFGGLRPFTSFAS